eukprot:677239-Prymnesium_polylepis.1
MCIRDRPHLGHPHTHDDFPRTHGTATQWRNRINEHNPGMYTKEYLNGKTAKELAQIQNGKSYGNPSKHDR